MKPLVFLLLFIGARSAASQNPEVNTTSGMIIGVTLPESHAFYGVRYAKPPIGELRFLPPVRAPYAEGKQNLTQQTFPRCFQLGLNCSTIEECPPNYSEDCLFLDINVPSSVDLSSSEPFLPVMFWVHGGGFIQGTGNDDWYDGRYLANRTNTIVVSINYRLGALGFLYYEENGESFDGNQGIKDMQLALEWVYDNIEMFGGNKSQITIFGESAGAHAVVTLMMAPSSRHYIRHAIIQSFVANTPFADTAEAQLQTEELLQELGCSENKMQCLKNASALSIIEAYFPILQNKTTFFDQYLYRPILDGKEFSQNPFDFFRSTTWDADKKIIIGTTSEEAVLFVHQDLQRPVTKEQFMEQNNYYAGPEYGPLAAEEYLKYANTNDSNYDYIDLLSQEVTDMMFTCSSRAFARIIVGANNPLDFPLYSYVLDYPVKGENCEEVLGSVASLFCQYAAHAVDLFYVFNSGSTGLQFTSEGAEVANLVNDMWGHFAYNGKPTNNISFWQPYSEAASWLTSNPIIEWPSLNITGPTSEIAQIANYRSDICDFWDNLGFYGELPTQTPETTTSGKSPLWLHLPMEAFVCASVWLMLLMQ